ncbi:hypothetical protein PV377_02895 [Streptomyces ipomoeae]|uniref:hypothetical protein n=1 Tax=Streptomyces ipomoeae TaxID=103232 RepID=UPI0029ADB0EC|nr:hypothetical protein [Streptomyces ipomoeae]MDX2837959.1 hypothetical protein [Streptomyces ipomoeae]
MSSLREEFRADALALPDPAKLTADQVRGGHCCWCDTPLTAETAVDLGERRHPMHWFPRCCRPCIHATNRTHPGMCEQCAINAADCPTAHALRHLAQEYPQ